MNRITFILLLIVLALFSSCDILGDNSSSVDLNTPGNYDVGKSFSIMIPAYNGALNVILDSVTVLDDLSIAINIIWSVTLDEGWSLTKYSDHNNDNMNLTDNLGNTYYMLYALDAAGYIVTLENGESASGSFIFPEPESGISELVFHDDDNGETISFSVSK